MKSPMEFKDTVYEKARLYEKKRKARKRKLIEATALCSVCIVIGISAWLVSPNFVRDGDEAYVTTDCNAGADITTTGSPLDGLTQTTAADTTSELAFETTTPLYPSASATYTTQTEAPLATTITQAPLITSTTSASYYSSSTVEITESSTTESNPHGTEFLLEEICLSEHQNYNYITASLSFTLSGNLALRPQFAVLHHEEQLLQELDGYENRLSEFDRKEIKNTYDQTFFDENILILIPRYMRYEGYEVCFKSGGATNIKSVGEELPFKPYMLHTYVIPKSEYDSYNILTYSYTEYDPPQS